MIPYKQLSLADIFTDCQEKFQDDKPAFLSLLHNHIDLDEMIPVSFRNHFYASTGRSRKYPLQAFLWALIIQRIFSIPTDQLLLTFLAYSKPLRDFCGFTKVPDASKITRFKQDFLDDLQLVFDNLVDITEPVCQAIDSAKADMTIFDSSGIEAFVTENNPKYANRIIRQLKTFANPSGGLTDNAAVKIPVPLQDVAVWSIFIPKKISVLILEQSVAPKNGIIHTKSELLLSEGFITSKSISASPGAEPRMRKHSMQISSLQESPNSLPLFLLIKSTATNTFEA